MLNATVMITIPYEPAIALASWLRQRRRRLRSLRGEDDAVGVLRFREHYFPRGNLLLRDGFKV